MSFRNSCSSRSRLRSLQRAFTLLEIMVVLAILGLLVGVLVVNVGGQLDRGGQDAAALFVKTTLKAPLTAYRIDMGSYPSTAEGLKALTQPPQSNAARWRGPYVDGNIPNDPWQQSYEYRYPGKQNPTSYDLFSKGPDQTADTADDIGNW